ncbi:MAG: hypothetical protein ACK4YV_10495 [Emticicia sp.]
MFDSGYKFALISKTTVSKKLFLRQRIYNFRSLFRRYIAVVEEYELNVFIVKFFPVSHKLSDKKYNVIFNDFDAPRVIRTCIDIMLSIATENELASFGFIGANTISEDFYENEINTQRFRIYRRIMLNFFREESFSHLEEPSISAYLMVNKKNKNFEELTPKIVEMFQEVYPDLIF